MQTMDTGIAGVVVIEPQVFGDSRGFFKECWNARRFAEAGLPDHFVQSNVSRSAAGVLRGLHYQYPNPQGKLVQVLEGAIFDVAVDIRSDSPTFGQWMGIELSAANHRQLYVPEGCAHGFCVLGEIATLSYLCTALFEPEYDAAVAWDDPQIGIEWPIEPESLSDKDRAAPRLADIPKDRLPRMQP